MCITKVYEPLLDHNELLVNGVDYLQQMVRLNKILEINGFYNVIKPIMHKVDNVQDFSLTNLVGPIVLYGIGIVIFIVVIFVQSKVCCQIE